MRFLLGSARNWSRMVLTRFLVGLARFLFSSSRCTVILSNDTTSKIDGTGAQIQRLICLHALSAELGLDFLQNLFVDVSVHPLDPFQDPLAKDAFIRQMNDLFELPNRGEVGPMRIIDLKTLSAWSLLRITIASLRDNEPIRLNVVEPYPITDAYPDIAFRRSHIFPKWEEFANFLVQDFQRPFVSIHYRQGVGGAVLYPGQKIPRELPPTYFYLKLRELITEYDPSPSVYLFTDAPVSDITYKPDVQQHYQWDGTPGFIDGIMEIKGNDLSRFFQERNVEVKVHIGGNPLEAIAIMSKSNYLITSRSSLSYVAGLLNASGTIVASDGFWHPSPSSWI
jgi:hypothetical protein